MRIIAVLILMVFLSVAEWTSAAQDNLGNIGMEDLDVVPRYRPGSVIALPDGRQTIIREYLPNGQLITDLGVIISPEGVIVEGEGQGQSVTILEQAPQNVVPAPEATPVKPDAILPEANPDVRIAVPENKSDVKIVAPEQQQTPVTPPIVAVPGRVPEAGEKPAVPDAVNPAGPLSIVELLPMTRVPDAQKQTSKPENKAQTRPEQPEKAMKPEQKVKPDQPEKKPKAVQKQPEKKQPEPKAPEKFKKPGVGQEMRIPPDAAKTGNLDFLEGCWQGTRPEYYSKRTIRECFCFGSNGKNGKRRVFDPANSRMCIGSAKANLSKAGVLSVTSSGAACSDGERWGSAQMSCRNSGPKTPCSWMFPDAQGGHQSYTIPFVRVESCGR